MSFSTVINVGDTVTVVVVSNGTDIVVAVLVCGIVATSWINTWKKKNIKDTNYKIK